MKRWLPIILILAAGIVGAIWLIRSDAPGSRAGGSVLSSNALARARVSGGGSHALAIAPDGSLWSWGDLQNGAALGLGKITAPVPRPARVGQEKDWVEVSAGFSYSLAIKRDGSLWAWGGNAGGMLGDGTTQLRDAPTRVGAGNDWLMAGTGLHHSLGLKRDGTIWAWGENNYGQLGVPELTNTTNRSFVPIRVGTDTNWKSIAVCSVHNVALKTDGTLWTWGDSALTPAAAPNSPSNHYAPVRIGSDTNWVALAPGYYHTVALKSDGTLWHWGRNSHLLGSIPAKILSHQRQFGTHTDWSAIYDGGYHNLARKSDGSLWQLGRGGGNNPGASMRNTGDWVLADGGAEFTVAMGRDGSLWSWGEVIGVRKHPGWFKVMAGELLQKVGVRNELNQPKKPRRKEPEQIFQLPGGP